MVIYLEDQGNFDADVFAANGVLPVGLEVQLMRDSAVQATMTAGEPVKTNGQLMHYASAWSQLTAQGSGTSSFKASWDFGDTFGQSFRIEGRHGEAVRVALNDSFVGINYMEFLMYGHRIIDPSRPLSF
jgi:hypothetical protein